jgi:murein DD-endopeptidase MepM/ murein hydrolase activator NlpD
MNPYIFVTAWSFRKQLVFVASVFLGILTLPVIAVIILANTGINVVSDTLVHLDIGTHTIQLFDPTGAKYKDLEINTSWPVYGVITLGFGESDLPYQPFHTGIDIANPQGKIGDNIIAMMPGKVIYAEEISWGYGKHIIIDHGNNVTTLYGHLSKILVIEGQEIKAGEVIGQEGQTGWATGPHLHFEVRVFGIPVNPITFLGKQS